MESKINFVDLNLVDADSDLLDASQVVWQNIPRVNYKNLDPNKITYLPIFIRTPFTIDAIWKKIPNDIYLLMQQSKIKPLISMVTEQWDLFNTYAWKKNKFNITPDFADIPYSKVIKNLTLRGIAEENITWLVPHVFNEAVQIRSLQEKGYSVKCRFVGFDFFMHQIAGHTKDYDTKDKKFDKSFACLCQSKRIAHHRLAMIYELQRRNLLDKGMVSCTRYENIVESKKSNWLDDGIDTDTYMNQFEDFAKNKKHFETLLPINFDNKINAHFDKTFDETHIFDKSFLWVSNETKKEHSGIFITEKTYKAIAYGNPFVINGDNGSIKYLQMQGFKTFDKWWSEDYDLEKDQVKIKLIANIIEKITLKNKEELQKMYGEMKPVLDHNRKWLQNFNGLGKIIKVLND